MGCAVALIVTAALIAAISSTPRRGPNSGTERPPLVLTPATGRNDGARHRRTLGTRKKDGRDSFVAARRSARSFLPAFLRYQHGDTGARTRATLARTASGAVNRYLVDAPVRGVADGRHPKFRSLRLYARNRTETKASALLAYGRRQSVFEFLLALGQRGWRVVELYP